jgi:uncharacterized membrane protein
MTGLGQRTPRALVVTLLFGAAACGGEAPGGGEATSRGEADAGPSLVSSEPERLTGYLTVEDVPLLTLCGTGEEYTLDGPAYADLLDLHAVLAPGMEPMEGVFVDVLGARSEGERGPVVEVLEVRRAAWEGGGCSDAEPGLAFRAQGTEPFWSLSVLEDTLTWRTPEGQRTLAHRGPYRSDRGDWLVDGTPGPTVAGSGVTPVLMARFYPEPCRDAMSGAWFHMSAEVQLDGREYRGCAFAGGEF